MVRQIPCRDVKFEVVLAHEASYNIVQVYTVNQQPIRRFLVAQLLIHHSSDIICCIVFSITRYSWSHAKNNTD